jgi:serine/threonine protein kinase/ligand-binding sensor domain-containing protein
MDNLQSGQMLGPYRIMNQIGQGGMATVYRAYQASMNRYVAVKVLPSQLAESPEFFGRFQQEAQIIANLEHPHILPVHDYGESNGISYLAMRFIDTGTLKDQMANRPLSLNAIDIWFTQLADALAYAHNHGVVHRDLKPSNVLVDERGNLFLTDFGIAKLLQSSAAQFTSTGALMGTPDYMSPEQAQGLPIDQHTDIYSLGIILYEMLTEHVPFEAETPLAVILKHIGGALPLPSSIKPDIPPAIEQVLLKALAKEPVDRFGTMDEFRIAWKNALAAGKTVPAQVFPHVVEPTLSSLPAHQKTDIVPADVLSKDTTGQTGNTPRPHQDKAKMPFWALAGLGLGGLAALICIVVALGFTFRNRLFKISPQPTANRATISAETAEKPTQSSLTVEKNKHWTSWVAGNQVWSVIATGDRVISGGVGLSIWRADGTLEKRFNGVLDGLPDEIITSLLVDPRGILWVGSYNGVGRYDGSQWQHFSTSTGLDSTTINVLAQAANGIYIGSNDCDTDGCGLQLLTTKGLERVAGFPSKTQDQPNTLSRNVSTILPLNHLLWVGTSNGLAKWDGSAWTTYFEAQGLPNSNITVIAAGKQDREIWIGTASGAAQFDGQRLTRLEHLTDVGVNDIFQDASGLVWFTTSENIQRFDPASDTWQVFNKENNVPEASYHRITQQKDGLLYFGSANGLIRFDGKSFTSMTLPNVPVYDSITRILPAKEQDRLWMIGQGSGWRPDVFDARHEVWSIETGLPEGCLPLALDAKGTFWCGGEAGLWVVRADGGILNITTAEGLPSNHVVEIKTMENGSAWVGTASQGLSLFDGKEISQTYSAEKDGLTSNEIRVLHTAADGSLWVGTAKGVDHLAADGAWTHYPEGKPFSPGLKDVNDINEDANGAIWLAASGEGGVLYRFADNQWQRFSAENPRVSLPNDSIQCITLAPDGSLWFGGYYAGAARYDGKTWTKYNVSDGLVYSNVYDIFVDQIGTVWFATSGGVSRYIP